LGNPSDLYQSNLDGVTYNDSIYGIWAWTDVRGIWYWKDLLNKAGVDPNSLETWNGYITAAKKLNTVSRPQGIESVQLTGASHSPDLWYPFLWMLAATFWSLEKGIPQNEPTGFQLTTVQKGFRL
jgi:multiple sugar transport system substrate-binding protein